jgi:hypothetical protein
MWIESLSFILRRLWLCLICASMFSACEALGAEGAASAKQKRIHDLVESLASTSGEPVRRKEGGAEYFAFPANFNWNAYQRISKTIGELAALGLEAFPELVAHAGDARFCCLVDGFVVPERRTVGDVCEAILNSQVEVYDYAITREDRMIPSSLPGRYFGDSTQSAADWWEKNKTKSLLEMQILAAENALRVTKNRKASSRPEEEELREFERRRAGNIENLDGLISKLRKTQKADQSRGVRLRVVPHGLRDDEKRREVRVDIGK